MIKVALRLASSASFRGGHQSALRINKSRTVRRRRLSLRPKHFLRPILLAPLQLCGAATSTTCAEQVCANCRLAANSTGKTRRPANRQLVASRSIKRQTSEAADEANDDKTRHLLPAALVAAATICIWPFLERKTSRFVCGDSAFLVVTCHSSRRQNKTGAHLKTEAD